MLGRYKDLGVYFIALADREQHVRQFAREKLGVGELDIIGEGAHIPKLPLGFLQVQGEIHGKLPLDKITPAEVAVSQSHTLALEYFKNDDAIKHGLFFEDDITIDDDVFAMAINSTEMNSNNVMEVLYTMGQTSDELGWQGLNLGRCWDDCPSKIMKTYETAGIDLVETCNSYCAHAYFMTKKGAEVMIKYTRPIRASGDGIRCALSQEGLLKYYSTSPRMFNQDRDDQKSGLHSTDRLPECVHHKAVVCKRREPWVNAIVTGQF